MRGVKVSRTARKEIDAVVIAARYDPESGLVSITQGYRRRGTVWGDLQLLDRNSLIEMVEQGVRVVSGRLGDIEGDFEVISAVQFNAQNGDGALYTGDKLSEKDELGVPLF